MCPVRGAILRPIYRKLWLCCKKSLSELLSGSIDVNLGTPLHLHTRNPNAPFHLHVQSECRP
jgi:hypothetical protein